MKQSDIVAMCVVVLPRVPGRYNLTQPIDDVKANKYYAKAVNVTNSMANVSIEMTIQMRSNCILSVFFLNSLFSPSNLVPILSARIFRRFDENVAYK